MTTHPHQQAQQQQQPTIPSSYESRLGVVETRVSSILDALEHLSRKFDARSAVNWQPIGILATLILAATGGSYGLMSGGQARLEAMIAKQEASATRFVPREDLDPRLDAIRKGTDERFVVTGLRRDDAQKMTDARIERAERDVAALERGLVPRGEHEQMWAGQRVRDDGLQRQIDELRKGLTELNTPRDTIQGILRRLDELDRAARGPAGRGAP